MKIEEFTVYTFRYTPWNKSFPIKSCELTIYAKTRKEAELIAISFGWKFFDEDVTVSVSESKIPGYRQVNE